MFAKFGGAMPKYFKVFTVSRPVLCLSVMLIHERDNEEGFPVNILVLATGLSSLVLQPEVKNHFFKKRTKSTIMKTQNAKNKIKTYIINNTFLFSFLCPCFFIYLGFNIDRGFYDFNKLSVCLSCAIIPNQLLRTNGASLPWWNWPPSCLRLQFQPLGDSTVSLLFVFIFFCARLILSHSVCTPTFSHPLSLAVCSRPLPQLWCFVQTEPHGPGSAQGVRAAAGLPVQLGTSRQHPGAAH